MSLGTVGFKRNDIIIEVWWGTSFRQCLWEVGPCWAWPWVPQNCAHVSSFFHSLTWVLDLVPVPVHAKDCDMGVPLNKNKTLLYSILSSCGITLFTFALIRGWKICRTLHLCPWNGIDGDEEHMSNVFCVSLLQTQERNFFS